MSTAYTNLDKSYKRPLKKVQLGVVHVPPVLAVKGVRSPQAAKRRMGVNAGFPILLKS